MYIMALVQWSHNGIYEIGYIEVYDEKVAKLAQDEASIVLMETIFFYQMVRSELATLDSWVQQSVGQVGVDRVGLFIIVFLFAIPIMPSQLSFWVQWLSLLNFLSFATCLMQLKNVACNYTCCMQLQNSCMWDFLVA
jgi:cytochrome c-type biogenesis protein CcmH/NrfG